MTQPPPPEHVNVFFRLAVAAAALFVVTIFAFTATLFGDPASPAAMLLQRNAGKLFASELAALIALGLAAMVVDRRQSLRHQAGRSVAGETDDPAAADDVLDGGDVETRSPPQAGMRE